MGLVHIQERVVFEQVLLYQSKKGGQKMNVRANLKSCLIMAMFLIAMVKGLNGYKENDWR